MSGYITYNHINFNDTGIELFKFCITLSVAIRTNKTLVFFNDEYMSIIDRFIKYKYKSISIKEFNDINFSYHNYGNKKYDDNNIYIIFKDDENYNIDDIDDNVKELMSLLFASNELYNKYVYNKINEWMNYFSDYDINNYTCIYLRKDIDKETYDKYISEKKLIIFTDNIYDFDINTDNKKIVIQINDNNKYSNFILMTMIPNVIITDINYYIYMATLIGNKNKKIIYLDENIGNT